ncbi:MAG TPA: hypothetical protein VIM51_00680 [Desulfosporosinus sp.]
MQTKKMSHQYSPITVEGKNFQDFELRIDNSDVSELFATAEYLSHDLIERGMLDDSIMKLFKEAFDIDIKTCTEREWAERITIKGGALKQWQSLLTQSRDKEMDSRKASLIFIAVSLVLLLGIGLLPKSVPVLVPASAGTSSVTSTSATEK